MTSPLIQLEILLQASVDHAKELLLYDWGYNGYDFIIPRIIFLNKKHGSLDISLSLMFIEILAKIPDSHISRKLGEKISKKTSNHANDLLKILDKESSHEYLTNQLNKLDYEYKKKGINPGTTADLLLASLMIYKIFISN